DQDVVDRLGEEETERRRDEERRQRLDQPRAQLDQVRHQRGLAGLDLLLVVLGGHAPLPDVEVLLVSGCGASGAIAVSADGGGTAASGDTGAGPGAGAFGAASGEALAADD